MPDAAILNGTKRHPGTKHGKACAMSPCDKSKFRDYVVLCPRASPRDAIPMALRLPRRYAPRNDTESGRFCSKRMFCTICGHFLCSIALHRVSNVSFQKSFRFPAKPTDFVIARRAHFCAQRGNLKRNETASRNELRGREGKRPLAASR